MPKQILRPKVTWGRVGRGRTTFSEQYVLRDPRDPYIPGTRIKRLTPIRLGPRDIGFLESAVDQLIDALASDRNNSQTRTARRARSMRRARS